MQFYFATNLCRKCNKAVTSAGIPRLSASARRCHPGDFCRGFRGSQPRHGGAIRGISVGVSEACSLSTAVPSGGFLPGFPRLAASARRCHPGDFCRGFRGSQPRHGGAIRGISVGVSEACSLSTAVPSGGFLPGFPRLAASARRCHPGVIPAGVSEACSLGTAVPSGGFF